MMRISKKEFQVLYESRTQDPRKSDLNRHLCITGALLYLLSSCEIEVRLALALSNWLLPYSVPHFDIASIFHIPTKQKVKFAPITPRQYFRAFTNFLYSLTSPLFVPAVWQVFLNSAHFNSLSRTVVRDRRLHKSTTQFRVAYQETYSKIY